MAQVNKENKVDFAWCRSFKIKGYSTGRAFPGSVFARLLVHSRHCWGNLSVNPHLPMSKFLKPTFSAGDSGRTWKL